MDFTPGVEIHKKLTPISLTKMGIKARVRGSVGERKREQAFHLKVEEGENEQEREARKGGRP
jgi:hypothetical protein